MFVGVIRDDFNIRIYVANHCSSAFLHMLETGTQLWKNIGFCEISRIFSTL